VSVTLPPLRERRQDLEPLAVSLCARHGLRGVERHLIDDLMNYDWPGNVRELNNWIERASILGQYSSDGLVTSQVPHTATVTSIATPRFELINGGGDLKSLRNKILDEYDRRWIERSLQEHEGNVSATAKALGIDRKNLTRRMKDLGFKKAA
jgi:transcriptional regulator with PAS, ATPase and Fis domain